MLREFKDNAHQRTKASLGRRPRLFFKVRKLIYQDKRSDQVVDASHDIVIEGVPRCANSFAVTAFRFAQPGSVKIAHHLHTPAQVLRGVELDLPCLVLVRNPRETIISHKALQAQNRLKGRKGVRISFKTHFYVYISFYSTLLKMENQNYVVAPFREVITDYGKCIRRLNNAFQTNFSLFNHTKINVNYVMSQEGYHAGPSDMRENLKHQYEEKYESLVNGKLCKISNRADKIYEKFLVSGLCPPKSLQ